MALNTISRMSLLSLSFLKLLSMPTGAYAEGKDKVTFKTCNNPMPALYLFKDEAAKKPEGVIADILDAAIKDTNYEVEYLKFPWKRCQEMLKTFEVDFLSIVAWSEERAKIFDFSESWSNNNLVYFWYKPNFPEGMKVKTIDDLVGLKKICGRAGFSYQNFNIDQSQIDMNAQDVPQVIKKLKAGNCNVYIDRFEGITAQEFTLKNLQLTNDKEFGSAIIPTTKPEPMYMGVLKNHPKNKEILAFLNRGIKSLVDSNEMHKLFYKWAGDAYFTYRPELKELILKK